MMAGRRADQAGIAAIVVALATFLLWPAVMNRGVFLFPDTTTYIRGADAAIYKLTGRVSDWTGELIHKYPRLAVQQPQRTAQGHQPQTATADKVVLAGRSVYYGAIVLLADLMGSMILMAMAQAAVIAAVIVRSAHHMAQHRLRAIEFAPLLILPFVSSLAFFACFMMPDLFAATSLVATAILAVFWPAMSGFERVAWLLILIFGLLSHSANLIIVSGIIVIVFAANLCRLWHLKVSPVVAALGLALVGEALFSLAVQRFTGAPPVRPPFLTARLIEDGPGFNFLRSHCGKDGDSYQVCKYIRRMPAPSDGFLWSPDPRIGVFSATTPNEQRRMSNEEIGFAIAVFSTSPLATIQSTATSVAKQSAHVGLVEFNDRNVPHDKLPQRLRSAYGQTAAANGKMPVQALSVFFGICYMASVALIVLFLRLGRADNTWFRANFAVVAILVSGVAVTALVCGGISTPHDRYLSRVLWLLPFIALAMTARFLSARFGYKTL